ncbi:ceramide kinase-like [Liolophura sinensis]|uniref:ceramide kinase-like n=1 Tax=Liolophura sinensis TaxID=3198878 RepID=UPI00315837CA
MYSNPTVVVEKQLKIEHGKDSKDCRVVLTKEWLTWALEENSGAVDKGPKDIPPLSAYSDIVRVRVSWVLKTDVSQVSEESDDQGQSKLDVHYAVRISKPEHRSDLSLTKITFLGTKEACEDISQAVKEEISQRVPRRPKSLLVIINPASGKGSAEQVYRKHGAPIFELCGIKTDVQVTKRAKHSDEILDKYDLTTIDGVVAVGGDGTLTEVVNALLKRTMKDAGIDENDPDVVPKTPSVTCGMFPGGSANGNPLYVGYSKQPSSIAIMIAIGHSEMLDVMTIHCGKQFLAYGLLMLGYGQMARVMGIMEDNRWAGPARYLALPFCLLLKRKLVNLEVEYLPADTTSSESSSTTPNQGTASPVEGATCNSDLSWKKVSGMYLGVDAVSIHPSAPNYDKPFFAHQAINDGKLRLWLSKECGRMEQVSFFNKLKKYDHTAFDVNFLECYEVKAFKIRAVNPKPDDKASRLLIWDGDMLQSPEPHAEIRNHHHIVHFFTRDDGEELRQAYLAKVQAEKS